MPVYHFETPEPEPTGPTYLRLWMTQREPYVGSTVYVNVEARTDDGPQRVT
jgi:hypothetical protein